MNRKMLIGGVAAVAAVAGAAWYAAARQGPPSELLEPLVLPRLETPATPQREVADAGAGIEVAAADWDPGVTDFDKVLGSPDAPVTIIEYASFTCSHCASFHANTLPALKERYIDTGKVRLVFRDFPLDGLALRAGMIARCAPEAQYFNVVSAMFDSQERWATSSDPLAALGSIGRTAGMSAEEVDACLADEALSTRITELRQQAEALYQVAATPTFVIQGKVMSGALAIEELAERIDPFLAQ